MEWRLHPTSTGSSFSDGCSLREYTREERPFCRYATNSESLTAAEQLQRRGNKHDSLDSPVLSIPAATALSPVVSVRPHKYAAGLPPPPFSAHAVAMIWTCCTPTRLRGTHTPTSSGSVVRTHSQTWKRSTVRNVSRRAESSGRNGEREWENEER